MLATSTTFSYILEVINNNNSVQNSSFHVLWFAIGAKSQNGIVALHFSTRMVNARSCSFFFDCTYDDARAYRPNYRCIVSR